MPLWNPSEVSTNYWFDASDVSLVDVSGGQVTAWHNNSGTSMYVSPVSTTPNYVTGAINSLNAIQFSESSDAFVFPNKGVFNFKTSATIFVVGIGVASSAGSRDFVVEKYAEGYEEQFIAIRSTYSGTQTSTEAGYTRAPYQTEQSLSVTHAASGAAVMMSETDWEHASLRVGVNGTITPLGSSFQDVGTSYSPDGADYPYIGLSVSGTAAPVTIGEVLIITGRVLSDRERQCFEGYLAWKWGIALPSGHPYELAAPQEGDHEEPVIPDPVAAVGCFGASGESGQLWIGQGASSFAGLGVSGESSIVDEIIGDASFPGVGSAGSALSVALDSGSSSLSGVGVSGEASNVTLESGGFSSFKGMGASGESWQIFPASGDASLTGLGASGSCRLLTNIAAGNSSLSCIGASCSSRTVLKADGSTSVAGIGASGDSHAIYISTGDVALAGAGAAGVCAHVFPVDGSASFFGVGASGTTSNIPLVSTGNASFNGIGSAGSSTLIRKGDGAALFSGFGASGSSRIIFQSIGNASFYGIGAIGSDDSTPMVAIGSAGLGSIRTTGYSVPGRVSYGTIVLGGIGALGLIPGADVFDGILDFDRETQGSGPFADSGAVSAVEFGRDSAPTGDLVDFGGSVNTLVFSRPSCS